MSQLLQCAYFEKSKPISVLEKHAARVQYVVLEEEEENLWPIKKNVAQ